MKDNQAKYPQLRFKGFTDPWEERKLSDLFIKGGSGGTPKSTNKAFYDGDIPFLGISDITKSNGFINNTEKHISSDGLNSSAAWIVSKGAISLAMYASVGKLAILNIDAATSQAFYNMIFDDYDLRDLVYQRLNKANELSEWNKLISTGTQSNLNADKVKNFQMYLPKNHDEIKLISTFFKQIDNTIVLHQRKLAKLKELKQGYLQKMFPKNGSKFPQLRFAGFADAWEERKLGDYVIIRSGWSPSNFDINNNANNLFIKVDDLNYSTRVQEESQVKVNILSKYKKMKKSSTIFPKRGAAIMTNKVRMLGEDSYMDTNMMALEPKGIDPEYLYTFINKTGLYKIADTSTIPQINNKHIEPYLLLIPSLEEQHKIGSFFKQLDGTIALHQRKLDLLKEQKKGFLQKMFV